ncbi:MAG: transposase, partial [Spirochaetaceae bacterium]|nr:transposase [Spirochaetaceae bacterium]
MRKPRRLVDSARYHVIARANRREFILESDRIKDMFLSVITQAKRRFRFSIDTVCIMDNHIHLLLRPRNGESLSRIMQWILSVFAIR